MTLGAGTPAFLPRPGAVEPRESALEDSSERKVTGAAVVFGP